MSVGKRPNPINGNSQASKKFFWLVAGDVYFSPATQPEEVQQAQLNSILSTVAPVVNSQAMANAQAGLVQRLKDSSPDLDFIPRNVVFHSISPLGQMTDVEFFGEQAVASEPPSVQ